MGIFNSRPQSAQRLPVDFCTADRMYIQSIRYIRTFFQLIHRCEIRNVYLGSADKVRSPTHCLKVCKPRRKLAGQLAAKLFTAQEVSVERKPWTVLKWRQYTLATLSNYPLDRLETSHTAEKGIAKCNWQIEELQEGFEPGSRGMLKCWSKWKVFDWICLVAVVHRQGNYDQSYQSPHKHQ